MRKGISITVTAEDRVWLDTIIRNRNSAQKHVWRARIIVLTADGAGTTAITRAVGKGKTVVWRWQERFMHEGIEGLSSRPEDSHLRALPDPYVNLSIHSAPDVRPFPWQSCQWAKSVGFARRSRSNQSRAPLVFRRNRLNLRRAQRMT